MQLKKSAFVSAALAVVAATVLITAHAGVQGKPGTKIIYRKTADVNGPVVGYQVWLCSGAYIHQGYTTAYATEFTHSCGS